MDIETEVVIIKNSPVKEKHVSSIKRRRIIQITCGECNIGFSESDSSNCFCCACERPCCEKCIQNSHHLVMVCKETLKYRNVCKCEDCAGEYMFLCKGCSEGGFNLFTGAYIGGSFSQKFKDFLVNEFKEKYSKTAFDEYDDVRKLFFDTTEEVCNDCQFAPCRFRVDEVDGCVTLERYNANTNETIQSQLITDIFTFGATASSDEDN